ncbi:Protein CBG27159 [Caenorhabditis briggsae]|uniref:Protein CBG27159 n=1 Tax=Caenorhabditis briggsae TaxID=6238 RepID=B6IL68_CAEBR|nr:Protein CBG27159 [Caenorhabditis briggsae]CAS00621.1 Protein CBG27159 [Caenorhabditis briggsae]
MRTNDSRSFVYTLLKLQTNCTETLSGTSKNISLFNETLETSHSQEEV